MKDIIKIEETGKVIKDIEERFWDIPFENSDFQNKNFVVNSQITPARAYRSIGLRLHAKLRAIKEYKYEVQLREIDIEEKQEIIDDYDSSVYDKRRALIEINKLQDAKSWEQKLLNDALREVTCLYKELQKYPKYTREQFEAEERKHYELLAEQRMALGDENKIMLSNMARDEEILDSILQLYADDPDKVLTYVENNEENK